MTGGNKGDNYVPRLRIGEGEDPEIAPGGEGGGSGGGSGIDPCDITQHVHLNRQELAVVSRLRVGDCLDVQLQKKDGQTLIATLHQGRLAGFINVLKIATLTRCLESGVTYKATVVDLTPGFVRVKLERGSCL